MTDIKQRRKNPYDPFENPSENSAYRTDYRKIVPQIDEPGYELPMLPEKQERKNIRHYFNAVGLGLLLGAVGVNIAFILVTMLLEVIMTGGSADFDAMMAAEEYIYNSSLMLGLNGLLFFFANLIPTIVGSRMTGIRMRSYFRPTDTTKSQLLRYMCIGIFLQALTGILYTWFSMMMESTGITPYEPEVDSYSGVNAIVVNFLYTVIIAPVTEELLYRGFVLKNLSRVSQRFGIIASAVLFGLAHENIAQFFLALPTGIFMARLAVKHNSLIPSIAVHMAVNGLAFVMSWLYEALPMNGVGGTIIMIGDLAYYAIAIVGLIFWIAEARKTRLPAETVHQSYRGIRLVLTSPWLIAAGAFHFTLALVAIASQNMM